MSLWLWAVIYIIGAVFTVLAFEWARDVEPEHPVFFWLLCCTFWPVMWFAVLFIYIFDRNGED